MQGGKGGFLDRAGAALGIVGIKKGLEFAGESLELQRDSGLLKYLCQRLVGFAYRLAARGLLSRSGGPEIEGG